MRSVVIGGVAAVLIAVLSAVIFSMTGLDSAAVFSGPNVRL
ncbi:hypothetical protein [Pelagibius sp.]